MREWLPRTLAEGPCQDCAGLGGTRAFLGKDEKCGQRARSLGQGRARGASRCRLPFRHMNPGDPRPLLDRHAARVLTRWRERLRALPPSSALAHPDLLGPLMAPALARVRQEASQPPEGSSSPASASTASAATDPVSCRCGLNPLVAFYLTGECATFDVLWGQADALPHLAPHEREQLCRSLSQAWKRVATDEISLFCSLCQRRTALEAQDKERAVAAQNRAQGAGQATPERACRGAEAVLNASVAAACSSPREKPSATGRRSGETRG